jgi:hypothetical protein
VERHTCNSTLPSSIPPLASAGWQSPFAWRCTCVDPSQIVRRETAVQDRIDREAIAGAVTLVTLSGPESWVVTALLVGVAVMGVS